MNTNILRNIAYKQIANGPLSILYSPAMSIFDLIIQKIDGILFFDKNFDHYHYYDLYIENSPLDHIQGIQSKIHNLQMLDLLWFHHEPPMDLKKEDLVIIRNQLDKLTTKVFPSINIASAWGYHDSVNIIPYGLPDNTLSINKTEKVVLLNLTNDNTINNLYNYLKQDMPDIHIINSISSFKSIEDFYILLNKYHVCIDIHNRLNILAAVNCGCKCITATEQPKELIGITRVSTYQNFPSIIQSLVNDPLSSSDLSHNLRYMQKNYSVDVFNSSVTDLINNIKYKEFFKL